VLKGLVVRRLVVSLLVGSLAIVGVAVAAGASTTSLAQVTVTGDVGQKPTVTFSAPFSAKSSGHREIQAGTGTKLVKGEKITFDFVVVDGRTGLELQSTYGQTPVSAVLDTKQTRTGLVNGLLGSNVGGRELLALAPKEGLTASLASQGVQKNDTLLLVVDVKDAQKPLKPLKRAKGTAVPLVAGLPTVKLASNGKPTITVPQTAAPTALVAQPLIKGAGPAVKAGDTIKVQYTGVIWNSGKKFDSSWDRGKATSFPIGVRQVIPGWDEGLVGQTVGSQILLVVPPDKGYGTSGQPQAGISGTDTLVFVVDILQTV
jgi:FKBP-type peptidyl-prolyl cis-trans isomerase 2